MCKGRLALLTSAVAALLVPCGLSRGQASTNPKRYFFQAILNGKVFPQKTLELAFVPGRPNLLELRPDWDLLKCDEVKAVVKKILPNSTTDVLEASIKRPGKSFFTLGPVTVMCRLTPGVCAKLYHQPPACQLEVTATDGKQLVNRRIALGRPGEWTRLPINVIGWPQGDYDISLYPVLDEKIWREGPRIVYRRRISDSRNVQVSHLAPWRLERDRQRENIEITNFRQACTKWASRQSSWDRVS